ncbi:MAG: hypothetical protein JST41_07010 [Bacteroidetes bacterium]|nr:hypothetical protein [Bacteroidota bacterium]MBX7127766.1 hypothetical protein [Flavobacteriales bacterium]MCC6655180.1 hypothetical protein [Flavobacteriales bacterium]HMU13184.1 hypothetical protein [Flavobacteriales bacterium]HMZ49514.1 hypothetical protein [Flavobacteriales bacterium]
MNHCCLHLGASWYKCDIRWNDVSVARMESGNNLSTNFSVNEWLREGENMLSIDLVGNGGEIPGSASMRVDIGLAPSVHDRTIPILKVELGPEDAKVGTIIRPVTIPRMPFAHYDDHLLEPIDGTDRERISAFMRSYEQYYYAMATKNLDAAMKWFAYRCDAYDRRYYMPTATKYNALRSELEHSFKHEFMLRRIPELEKLHIHMAGRLLTMDYTDLGLPLTTYTGKSGDYTRAYQAYWGMNSRGEFFIYR